MPNARRARRAATRRRRTPAAPTVDEELDLTVDPGAERVGAIEALDRAPDEDPYAALGIRAGSFILKPSLETGIGWNSNSRLLARRLRRGPFGNHAEAERRLRLVAPCRHAGRLRHLPEVAFRRGGRRAARRAGRHAAARPHRRLHRSAPSAMRSVPNRHLRLRPSSAPSSVRSARPSPAASASSATSENSSSG